MFIYVAAEYAHGFMQPHPNKTVLVVGAASFIGFHTTLALLRDAGVHNVAGLDNFNTKHDHDLKQVRTRKLKSNKHIGSLVAKQG